MDQLLNQFLNTQHISLHNQCQMDHYDKGHGICTQPKVGDTLATSNELCLAESKFNFIISRIMQYQNKHYKSFQEQALHILLWDHLSGQVTFTRCRCTCRRALSFTLCVFCTIIISFSLTSEEKIYCVSLTVFHSYSCLLRLTCINMLCLAPDATTKNTFLCINLESWDLAVLKLI